MSLLCVNVLVFMERLRIRVSTYKPTLPLIERRNFECVSKVLLFLMKNLLCKFSTNNFYKFDCLKTTALFKQATEMLVDFFLFTDALRKFLERDLP